MVVFSYQQLKSFGTILNNLKQWNYYILKNKVNFYPKLFLNNILKKIYILCLNVYSVFNLSLK